jgi:hypothetical protein
MKRLAAIVLALVAGTGSALGQARLGPYVVDNNGLKVGHSDFGGTNILTFFNGNPVVVSAGANGFSIQTFNRYFYDAACETEPYMEVATNLLVAPGFYLLDGNVHYPQLSEAGPVPLLSFYEVNPDGSPGPCDAITGSINGAPELFGPVSFMPPFKVVETLPVSPAPATATFNDVPTTHPFFQFIEALHASGITGGCQASPPLYCPDDSVSRGQMAVFLSKALGL